MGEDCGSDCGDSGSCGGHGEQKCGCCHEMPKEEMMYEMFMELSDAAWMKLLKQKLMAYYEKKMGHDMEKMAEFFAEAGIMKWADEEGYAKKKPEFMKMMQQMHEQKKKDHMKK